MFWQGDFCVRFESERAKGDVKLFTTSISLRLNGT